MRSLRSSRPAAWVREKACWQENAPAGHRMKPAGLQGVSQFHQGVVVVSVAVADHGDRQSPVALDGGHEADE